MTWTTEEWADHFARVRFHEWKEDEKLKLEEFEDKHIKLALNQSNRNVKSNDKDKDKDKTASLSLRGTGTTSSATSSATNAEILFRKG
ncbi:hypothetical protein SEMRO_306_G112910.1 [Seminavis robusta]|uniref:Uncharacterized protein n=1 Tax=Seminavis robusta TaxID=568900 RepID=A0A9N8DUQ6_9STRA|nr:hypothetical protein SEMRO_306_G112910.1 [Seminavis robusta]|eukprot:Sro306_g112910.1 n/a (88) ;mRNA; r:3165-3428